MLKSLCLALLLSVMLVSCATVASFRTDDSPNSNFPPTSEEKVKVFCTLDAGKSYVCIGQIVVAAEAGENADKAVSRMIEEAAEMGADAVVDLRLEFVPGEWDTGIKATATAVKFK